MIKQFLILFVFFAAAHSGYPNPARAEVPSRQQPKINVAVTILPQKYFVSRIGGKRVLVQVAIPPGQSPELYSPSAKQLSRLGRANLYFSIEVPSERSILPKIRANFPNVTIVETSTGLLNLKSAEHHHSHGPEHHEAEVLDPHTWLSPSNVLKQSEIISNALISADPEGEALYQENFVALRNDLLELDLWLKNLLKPHSGQSFIVFHPAYGYFAREYGLKQIAIEHQGKEPSAKQLARVFAQAHREGARMVFVQPQFSSQLAKKTAENLGLTVVELDPLQEDYMGNMRLIGRTLAAASNEQAK
jgi:zinc transport system substrate-binding protein